MLTDTQRSATTGVDSLPELIKQKDLQRRLDMSSMTVHRLVKAGKLPKPIKLGGINYFDIAELKAAFQSSKKEETAA